MDAKIDKCVMVIPVLKADSDKIRTIREKLFAPEFSDLIVVDFLDVAQSCNVKEFDRSIFSCRF